MRRFLVTLAAAAILAAAPAHAEVVLKSDAGFVSRNTAEVAATPDAVWQVLAEPAGWWNSAHTFSGDAANLSLDPRAGGCFCEVLPVAKDDPLWSKPGSVLHMTVINIEPGRALRLSGGLGPLQSEAVSATLTITLKPMGKGTRILFEYVVGGFMRYPIDQIAPAVDAVMAEQLGRLAVKVDPGALAAKPAVAGPPAPKEPKPAPKAAAPEEAPAPVDVAAAPAPPPPAPKPAPKPASLAPAPQPGYVTRTFTVSRTPAGYVLTGADDTAYFARFTGKVGADSFATAYARFAEASAVGALDKGKTVTCTCTGSFGEVDGKPAFTVIAAEINLN